MIHLRTNNDCKTNCLIVMVFSFCSESGKFLVSLGGPLCRVWDVKASAAIASLSKEKVSGVLLFVSLNFVYKLPTLFVSNVMSFRL